MARAPGLGPGGRRFESCHPDFIIIKYAGMAELADAPDLGSGGRPCRFKSCCPHECESSVCYRTLFLLLFRAKQNFIKQT